MQNGLTLHIRQGTNPRRTYLEVLNVFFALTKRELDVLEASMVVNPAVPAQPEDRQAVGQKVGMSVPVLNNSIKHLTDKGAIRREGRNYTYHPYLLRTPATVTLQFV